MWAAINSQKYEAFIESENTEEKWADQVTSLQ